jgi:hypothetical protein
LANGEITLAKWQQGMSAQIKNSHLAAGASAKGGWAQMSQADYGQVGGRLKRQYEYLNNFAADIASGKQKLNGNFLRRADMYLEAARGTYEEARRRLYAQSGYTEERRVLGRAEHCKDCLDFAGRRWQPINTLPPIGASICLTNCHCRFIYRKTDGSTNSISDCRAAIANSATTPGLPADCDGRLNGARRLV